MLQRQSVDDCIEDKGDWESEKNRFHKQGTKEWKGKGSHSEKAKEENVESLKLESEKSWSILARSPSSTV